MGAGLLLKYAANSGESCIFKAIAAVSTPFDYIITREVLNNWWPYFGYSDKYIIKSLREQYDSVFSYLVGMKKKLEEQGISLEEISNCKSSLEFDTKFTIKLYGYESPEKYYHDASVVHRLENIKIPVLALSSKDDPIVSPRCIPYDRLKEIPNVVLAVTFIGGHVSWYTGIKPERWYSKPCLEFLDAVLG